ncbi:DUF2948 family protein [Prosthecodimorpha staleyi]|uniref:DUF2948 family protein n=1 Tax=Prosthecodimorpha staleyi TaxID=2840188 RepID=A0A947D3Y0_9HYPH|nr:DUF2948 family protein [Prosthecodimorpha staleyi]MBT9290320.1 DUF2948 family protein [Prosthecodimorpha staleyi]
MTLKLVALDGEDLAVLSACVQDAVIKVGDLDWQPKAGLFALAMNRFAWEQNPGAEPARSGSTAFERRRACLHFARVGRVRSHGIDRHRPGEVLVLLAITFTPSEGPSGVVELLFAGDAAIRLDVECLEAQLADLGGAWATGNLPAHGR